MCLSLNEKKHDCVTEMLFLFVWCFQTNCRGYKKDVSCVFESVGFSLKYCSACTSDQQGALTETHCKEVYEILMFFSPEKDQPPVARVVSSPPISLPVRTATLDGSQSTDDKGGLSYLWTREDTSPAAGVRRTFIIRPLTDVSSGLVYCRDHEIYK